MERNCDVCRTPYEAKRATSRYCSATCRVRASRGGAVVPMPEAPPTHTESGVRAATRAQLEQVDRLNTPLGQIAMALAARLDSPLTDTGSAQASVARELRATIAEATKGAAGATAPEILRDELAARRARQGA